jgi:prepilin-type N-terminal cleavage/methylation domain-containing protein
MKPAGQGFTLIELSIVLVIIGLIVGGILVGRNLIDAAAVRAQISQIEKYQTAANTFRGKYGYLPGDIPNPDASNFGFQSRGPYGGQGDGNGIIEGNYGNSPGFQNGLSPFVGEQAMFWVDLGVAGLIDATFTASTPTSVISSTVSGSAVSQYLPASKIGNGGYVYVWSGGWQESWGGTRFSGDGQNYFALTGVPGISQPANGVPSSLPLLTPVQALAIDSKVDDGMPQFGNVMANISVTGNSGGWASGGAIAVAQGIPHINPNGAHAPYGFPVVAGGTVSTNGPNQGVTTTCYDNNATAGNIETYSLGNGNLVNCSLSFRLQ